MSNGVSLAAAGSGWLPYAQTADATVVTEMINDIRRLLERPDYAHIATLLPDGGPHSVPVWIDVEGRDELVVLTSPGSRKARNVKRDPRVAISITDLDQPYASVLIRGQVTQLIDGDLMPRP